MTKKRQTVSKYLPMRTQMSKREHFSGIVMKKESPQGLTLRAFCNFTLLLYYTKKVATSARMA